MMLPTVVASLPSIVRGPSFASLATDGKRSGSKGVVKIRWQYLGKPRRRTERNPMCPTKEQEWEWTHEGAGQLSHWDR